MVATGDPYHVRHKTLLIIATIGCTYHPSFERLYPSKWLKILIRCYLVFSFILMYLMPTQAILEIILTDVSMERLSRCLMVTSVDGFNIQPALWWTLKGKQLQKLCDIWDEWFEMDSDAAERRKLMAIHFKGVKNSIILASTFLVLSSGPWVLTLYFDENKTVAMPYVIPYKHQTPDFELALTAYLVPFTQFGFMTAASMYFALHPLCLEMVEIIRLKTQLASILNFRQFTSINKPTNLEILEMFATPYSEEELLNIRKRLAKWIFQHHQLMKFHDMVTDLIYMPLTFQAVSIFMTSWLIAFNVLQEEVPLSDKISEVFYCASNFLLFKVTCAQCDKLIVESNTLFDEAYVENWTVLPPDLKKSLLLISTRSFKPLTFTAMKIFLVGNETYMQILNSAFAVLNFCFAIREQAV